MSVKSIESTLSERAQVYGSYDNVSRVAQGLKRQLRHGAGWHALSDAQMESLDMICNKLARIVNGNPGYVDSWHDVAGYAQLVVHEMTRSEPGEMVDPRG